MKPHLYKDYLLLHLIIFMWGFTGILGKLILLDAQVIVWYRVLIASVSLLIYMLLKKRSFKIGSLKRLLQICITGVIVCLHWVTFYKSIQLSTASLGILCLSTTTLHVAWLEPIFMRRKILFTEVLLGLIVVYGIYFVSNGFTSREFEALLYGLTSALLAATFAVSNAWLASDTSSDKITLYEMITAFVFLFLVFVFQGEMTVDLFKMSTSDFWWLLFLGTACTSFAFLATIQIMKVLGAFTVSLSINLEPVYTIILAIIILHEHELLNNNFYIGSVVIILVVILNGIIKARQRKKGVVK